MKKLILLSFCIGAALLGCSDDDNQETLDKTLICRFDAFRATNGNPAVSYTDYNGRHCRKIDYYCLTDTMQAHGPAHIGGGSPLLKLMTIFNEDEIITFVDNRKEYINQLNDVQYSIVSYTIGFKNGDSMFVDLLDEGNADNKLKTTFYCVH